MVKSQHSVAQPVPRSRSHKNQIKMLAGLCSFAATDSWRHFKAHLSHWQNSVTGTISKKVPPVSLLTASSGLSVSRKGLSRSIQQVSRTSRGASGPSPWESLCLHLLWHLPCLLCYHISDSSQENSLLVRFM